MDDFHLLALGFARMNLSNLLSQEVLVCREITLKVLYDQPGRPTLGSQKPFPDW